MSTESRKELKDESYRQHFPVNTPQDNIATRREFLKVLGLTSGAFFAGTTGLAVAGAVQGPENFSPQKIAEVGKLRTGQSTTFAYPTAADPCLLVNLGNDNYVAYSQKCTHLACPVYWEEKNHRIECPCHEGAFDVKSGEPISGPPPRPLARVLLKVEGGAIYATGINLNLKEEEA